jgi:ATP-binding cassette subfamily B protein
MRNDADSKKIPRTPDKPLPFILYTLRHCSLRLKLSIPLAATLNGLGVALDTLIFSWMLGRIIGVIADSKGANVWDKMPFELGLLGALWILRSACFRAREYTERHYLPELMNTTRSLLFNRLIQQSQSFLSANFAGVLANHVRRAADVVGGLHDKTVYNIVPLLVRFILTGGLLWSVTPLLSGFILLFVLVGAIISYKTAPRWTKLSEEGAEASSRMSGYVVDGITNISAVQQNSGWREEQRRLGQAQDTLTDTYIRKMKYIFVFWGSFDAICTFFLCGYMALVAYGYAQGDVTTAQLAMCITLLGTVFGALASTISLLNSKFDDLGVLREALQKISTPISVMDRQDSPELKVTAGHIQFKDVQFSYNKDRKIFDGLNIDIPPGQRVGIVGVSGAGKTTLCQILLRAYDIQGGAILIDGQNIADVTQDSLHDAIAVIPQEPVLFHRSLKDNIRYGRLNATDDQVQAAAKAAEAAPFIDMQALKYDTLVGERGIKLSGGQRQRIAIARAILKNAPILVLDEATSALDSETEAAIQIAIGRAMEGRTTMVIAHRLSTLSRMDRILVMQDGRVIEDGSFDDLKKSGGIFARLWSMQAGGFLPSNL